MHKLIVAKKLEVMCNILPIRNPSYSNVLYCHFKTPVLVFHKRDMPTK